MKTRSTLTRYAWLSIGTAVLTILLKASAYWLTDSVGLLSDALESGVNLITAVLALVTLTIAAQPPDEEHEYGHTKAEYFSGGAEGTLILVAALSIGYAAVRRLISPQPLQQVGLGLAISVVAALFNGITALILLRAGRQNDSMTLRANARHLLTDVWTSVGVLVGVTAVALTGWYWLDPVLALVVAAHIARSGYQIVSESTRGLMDTALPPEELQKIKAVLAQYADQPVQYHALRTRQSGAHRFVSVHIQVPGAWTVQQGHALLEEIEHALHQELGNVTVLTHLEPLEDPVSWEDIPLNRETFSTPQEPEEGEETTVTA